MTWRLTLRSTFTRLIPPRENLQVMKTVRLLYLGYDFQMKKRAARKPASNKVVASPKNALARTVDDYLAAEIPAFKYKEVLVWYAAFSDHCSLFPTVAVIEKFKDELKPFRKSKGTIQFPIDKPLPASLIKKMVRARVAEVEAKGRR